MILIGLGSNLGDRKENIITAIQNLSEHKDIKIEKISSLYETKPMDVMAQPDFLNGVICIITNLTPNKLLEVCLNVENQMGRVRQRRWGPRNIDIDILIYDDRVIMEEALCIPHPRLHERSFVLVPLQEIAGDVPIYQGQTPDELLNKIAKNRDVVLYEKMDDKLLQLLEKP